MPDNSGQQDYLNYKEFLEENLPQMESLVSHKEFQLYQQWLQEHWSLVSKRLISYGKKIDEKELRFELGFLRGLSFILSLGYDIEEVKQEKNQQGKIKQESEK